MGKNYFITSHCRSAESNLYTKVAELQEDISLKRLDLGVAQLRLAAVQAQVSTFFVPFSYNHRHITQRPSHVYYLFISKLDMPYYLTHPDAKNIFIMRFLKRNPPSCMPFIAIAIYCIAIRFVKNKIHTKCDSVIKFSCGI